MTSYRKLTENYIDLQGVFKKSPIKNRQEKIFKDTPKDMDVKGRAGRNL